ncbi:MAG TPA: hypothetical protein VFV72_10200 [Candidatus Limnocylindrales bacterium]|nr:hypothetical protein [Candidatus Limnocylindrales bacterium]
MDNLFMQPVTLIVLAAGIIAAAYELRTSLEPVNCPECPHCREAAYERARQQRELQEQYARRNGIDGDDDDRTIG